jgi:hypothetical protein
MLSEEKLKNELSVRHKNKTFEEVKTIIGLCSLIRENNVEDTLTKVTKLVDIVKTYLQNSICQERFNGLAVLSIHKDAIAEIPQFNKQVIDLFAIQKDRRGQFLYK